MKPKSMILYKVVVGSSTTNSSIKFVVADSMSQAIEIVSDWYKELNKEPDIESVSVEMKNVLVGFQQ